MTGCLHEHQRYLGMHGSGVDSSPMTTQPVRNHPSHQAPSKARHMLQGQSLLGLEGAVREATCCTEWVSTPHASKRMSSEGGQRGIPELAEEGNRRERHSRRVHKLQGQTDRGFTGSHQNWQRKAERVAMTGSGSDNRHESLRHPEKHL